MAKYIERLEKLRDEGKISDDEFSELADLSAAKDAIKEFNSVKAERDELAAFKSRIETAPKLKEALKRVGIDYDAQPKYGQKTLDGLAADKLDDLDYVARFVKDEGFEATIQPEDQTRDLSGAEEIVNFTTDAGTGAPVRTGVEARRAEFLKELDSVPDGDKNAVDAVLAKYGMQPATEG